MCLYTHVCMHACVCLCTYALERKDNLECCSSCIVHLGFWDSVSSRSWTWQLSEAIWPLSLMYLPVSTFPFWKVCATMPNFILGDLWRLYSQILMLASKVLHWLGHFSGFFFGSLNIRFIISSYYFCSCSFCSQMWLPTVCPQLQPPVPYTLPS